MSWAVTVEGLTFRPEYYTALVEKGTKVFDDIRLNCDTDVVLATYPRTGTTWLSQIVSLLYAGEEGYEEASRTRINDRVIYMEFEVPGLLPERQKLENMKPQRLIKTHLPYRFMRDWVERDGVKTIVTLRNPKDTLISMYHFYKLCFGYKESWEDFFDHIKTGKQFMGDQVDWIEEWVKESEKNKNILLLKYEDMIEDLPKQLDTVIDFLGVEVSEKIYNRVLQDASFDSMRGNPMTTQTEILPHQTETKFIRSGRVGQWKDVFTVAQNYWFDQTYAKRLDNCNIHLAFE